MIENVTKVVIFSLLKCIIVVQQCIALAVFLVKKLFLYLKWLWIFYSPISVIFYLKLTWLEMHSFQ